MKGVSPGRPSSGSCTATLAQLPTSQSPPSQETLQTFNRHTGQSSLFIMADTNNSAVVPPKRALTDYPLIDSDPHVRRVFGYARPSDYAVAGGAAAASPLAFWVMERMSPSHVGRGGFSPVMRLATAVGVIGGLHILYQRSCNRFHGFTENSREVDMDMKEMVDKVKKGEPLYGSSQVSTYLQGVAARNSRYANLFVQVIPWFNLVNHEHHGVDTAKYYQQAERELEAERLSKAGSS